MSIPKLRWALPAPVLLAVVFSPSAAWACAACGCTLSSSWEDASPNPENAAPISSRFRLDVRYDYLNQSQLRSGTSTISPSAASGIVNGGNPQEVEQYTTNNYVTATLDYTVNPSWRLNAQLPYIFRSHSTLGTASDGTIGGAGGGQYDSSASSVGDVRISGVFQGFSAQHDLGVMLGAKLPTGTHSLTGTSTDPTAPGAVPIDRGLQPGTGTTDLILGLYYTHPISASWDYYTQDQYQFALDSSDGYRPGDGLNFNVGVHYTGLSFLTPQMQVNARYSVRDSGVNSDPVSTGGTLVYLSPGIAVPITLRASVYSFVQIPVYQDLNGVQLAPILTASLGARYVF